MSFTKAELVQKFLSGEFKIFYNLKIPTFLHGMTREEVLQKIKTPICLFPKDFWMLVAFLLSDAPKCLNIDAIEGVHIVTETRCSHLNDFFGSRCHLIKLEEGDKYWGLTQTGIVQKSMTTWISYQHTQLIGSLVTNFKPEFKIHDIRFWVVFDMVDNKRLIRPDVVYQTTMTPLEELYTLIENKHKEINQTAPDQSRPRLVYTVPQMPVQQLPVQHLPVQQMRAQQMRPNKVAIATPLLGLKRKAEDQDVPDEKKARKE